MQFSRFFQIVTTRDRGLGQQRRLKAIWEAAADSIGCPVDSASEFEARLLVEKILAVQKQVKEVAASIATVSSQFAEYQLLLTIHRIWSICCRPCFGSHRRSLAF